MKREDILYESERVRVGYLCSPEQVISYEDHELGLKDRRGEWIRYALDRGILEDLAGKLSDRKNQGVGDILDVFLMFNDELVFSAHKEGIPCSDIRNAILESWKKEKEIKQKAD
jgi:hypothetical protein